MADYNYKLSADQTRVTVTSELDTFDARVNWPATADVSRTVSLLAGRAVRCRQDGPGSETVCEYTVEADTHPLAIAETNFRLAEQAQLRIEQELDRQRDLDDETPSYDVWARSPEWRTARDATNRAYALLEQAQLGAS